MVAVIDLPPEILTVETFDGVNYLLPRPPFGFLRQVWWVLVVFALGMPCFAAIVPFMLLRAAPGPAANDFLPMMAFFVGVMAFFAVAPLTLGIFMLAFHFEIELTRDQVKRVVRAGPLRWTARRPLASVRQFTALKLGNDEVERVAGSTGLQPGALRAECGGARPFWLAVGYPHAWLTALAAELSRQAKMPLWEAPRAGAAIPVVERSSDAEIAERIEQPAESTAVFERHAGGLSITIAPMGIRGADEGGLRSLIGFAALASVMVPLLSAGLISLAFAGELRDDAGRPASPLTVALGMAVFWPIVVGLWLAVVHRGRRGAILRASSTGLAISQSGLIARRRQWRRDDLAGIRAERTFQEDSGSGGCWITDLRVLPFVGRPYKLLAYRPQAELEWIATTLREALALPLPSPDAAGPEIAEEGE